MPVRHRQGFTLAELLVVLTIVLLVAAVTLPTVIASFRERHMTAAATSVNEAIVFARNAAVKSNRTHGIRLVPDPLLWPRTATGIDPRRALAVNRVVQLEPAADYAEGRVNTFPPPVQYHTEITGGAPALVVEESPGDWIRDTASGAYAWMPNSPVSWFWNIRVGEKIELGPGLVEYTIVGPAFVDSPERFCNVGVSADSHLSRTFTSPDGAKTVTLPVQYLLLVNGLDDNGDGFIDEGFDGLDNNLINGVDDLVEWEIEKWRPGSTTAAGSAPPHRQQPPWPDATYTGLWSAPYRIRRRPVPSSLGGVELPSSVLIDLTTWATRRERSRLPIDPRTGVVELAVEPSGRISPLLPYSTPAAIGLDRGVYHLWLADRSDVVDPILGATPELPMAPGGLDADPAATTLSGPRALVTIFGATGRTRAGSPERFSATDPAAPFRAAEDR